MYLQQKAQAKAEYYIADWFSRGIFENESVIFMSEYMKHPSIFNLRARQETVQPPVSLPTEKTTEKKRLLPKVNRTVTQVVSYLQGRGVDMQIIDFCLPIGWIYEGVNYHNSVFVAALFSQDQNPAVKIGQFIYTLLFTGLFYT